MKNYLIKIGNALWFILTNIISVGAIEAAHTHHRFTLEYYLLAACLWTLYLTCWYWRMRKAPGRIKGESSIAYYLRNNFGYRGTRYTNV